jgi:DNA-binding NtrC family response regulator
LNQVVLIEDDEDIRVTALEFFEMEGIRAIGFADASIALSYLMDLIDRTDLPRLIIADLTLPGMSGSAFREAQMGEARLKNIPLAFMSAEMNIEATSRSLEVFEFLKKPIDLDNLLSLVRRHVPC